MRQRKPRPSYLRRNDRGKRGVRDIGKKISKRSVHADESYEANKGFVHQGEEGICAPGTLQQPGHVLFCRTCATMFLS